MHVYMYIKERKKQHTSPFSNCEYGFFLCHICLLFAADV